MYMMECVLCAGLNVHVNYSIQQTSSWILFGFLQNNSHPVPLLFQHCLRGEDSLVHKYGALVVHVMNTVNAEAFVGHTASRVLASQSIEWFQTAAVVLPLGAVAAAPLYAPGLLIVDVLNESRKLGFDVTPDISFQAIWPDCFSARHIA